MRCLNVGIPIDTEAVPTVLISGNKDDVGFIHSAVPPILILNAFC